MSKMGQYVSEQIEHDNYTLDERGKIHVSLSDRKECEHSTGEASRDSIQQDGGRRQHTDTGKKQD